ncbi:MAG: 2-dehydropantoate 2-reductase [Myxococcales bacterium]|nr:2-dehydropantoate 2-reductase [Myxococcales bacterium]
MGCGGIGGVVAAHLAELGAEVHAVARNPLVIDAVARQGYRVVGEAGKRTVPARIHATVPTGQFDFVLLATQPTDVEGAARQAAPALAPDGHMVCFQNGLCEDRVAAILGDPRRVIGGIVAWGASMVEPGVFDKTSAGGFVLGGHGVDPAAMERLDALLSCIGPVDRTENLAGARWSKLALNCVISSLGTLNGSTLGRAVRSRTVRRLALEIITEVVAVARAAGVRLEKVAGTLDLDWIALSEVERQQVGSVSLATKHAMLLAVGLRYRRLRSSMLRAIEAGRTPAIDFLNGEIVARAPRFEVPVPVNQAIVERVWAVARGELQPGPALLADLYERTRTT